MRLFLLQLVLVASLLCWVRGETPARIRPCHPLLLVGQDHRYALWTCRGGAAKDNKSTPKQIAAPKTPIASTPITKFSVPPAVAFHVAFAVAAIVVLQVINVGTLGNRILALVVGYNVALPIVAHKTNNATWIAIWQLLVPLSALMVVPDIFQVRGQSCLWKLYRFSHGS